jgi:hypothetical protein
MNHERIKQLANQAGFQQDMFGIGIWDSRELHEFVALIVRECAWEVSECYHPRHSFERHVCEVAAAHLESLAAIKKT